MTGKTPPLVGLMRGALFALAFTAGVVAGFARPGWVRFDPPSVVRD